MKPILVAKSNPQPASGRSRSRASRRGIAVALTDVLTIAVLVLGLLAAFQIAGIPEYVVPRPVTMLRSVVDYKDLLLENLIPTSLAMLLGFVIGNGAAFIIALVIIHVPKMARALLSVSLFLRSVPIVALTPILTLWLGLGLAPKVAIVVLITFFPTLVVTVRGLTSADPILLDLMRTLNASSWSVLTKVRIPASAPYVFSGLRIAAPTAVMGALVAEWLGSAQGIGHLMAVATFEFRTDLLWATIVVSACMGVATFGAVILAQRWLCPWSIGEIG
jgi:NitT/TauT family transport system permease protein